MHVVIRGIRIGSSSFHDAPHTLLLQELQTNVRRGCAVLLRVGSHTLLGRRTRVSSKKTNMGRVFSILKVEKLVDEHS